MLIVFVLCFAGTTAFSNIDCDHIVRVKERELKTIVSPNYPQKEPAGSTCRWTFFSDKERRIILVCPFYHKLGTSTPEDDNCNGIFTVEPDIGETTTHCRDKGFSRISLNHRMVITYENRLDKPVDPFTCYVHAKLKTRWDQTPHGQHELGQMQLYFNIQLGKNDMTQLVAVDDVDLDKSWSNTLWTVTAPPDSRITLSCPFTDKPPSPLTMQMAPCRGNFVVTTESLGQKTFHCSVKSIHLNTTDPKMLVIYHNYLGPPDDNFLCYVFSEPLTPTKTEQLPRPFKDCDYVLKINQKEPGVMQSSTYPSDTPPHKNCRWTFVSSEGSQMKIEAIEPDVTNKTEECGGVFLFRVAGRNITEFCLGVGFLRITPTNWVVMINKNLYDHPVPRFRFLVHEVPKKPVNESYYFGATGGFDNPYEDSLIILRSRETRRWVSPYYFDVSDNAYNASRITVVTPLDCRVVFTCHIPLQEGTGVPKNTFCEPDITVLTEERNNILQHCSGRPFAQSSPNNRMIIIFGKPNPLSTRPFSCEIYAEEKSPWNQHNSSISAPLQNPSCTFDIHLPENGMIPLATLHHPGEELGSSSCTWNVFAPKRSRIILSCPFRNEQPDLQFSENCSAYIIVSTEFRPNSTYCRDSAFLRTSATENMTVSYSNLSPKPFRSFMCFLYSEHILPSDACKICNGTAALPYENCDYIYNLNYHEMKELDFPQDEKPPGTFCRWTVVSPPNSRILLSCPYNRAIKEHSCNSHFTVHTGGRETRYCSSTNIIEYSTYNWTVLTYDNPSFDFFPAITCYAYVEKTLKNSKPCVNCNPMFAGAKLDYSRCDNVIFINTTEKVKALKTTNYPADLRPGVPCRWSVIAEESSFISMTCDGLGEDDDEEVYENQRCRGLIGIFGLGQDAKYHCRHESFGIRSTGNMLIVTYGNQIGLTKKGFKCSIAAADANCRHKILLRRPQYNKYFELSTPFWMEAESPYPSCQWSVESSQGTQLYLRCGLGEKRENLTISKTGDKDFNDAEIVSVRSRKPRVSKLNKMTILYNITKGTKPHSPLGCRIYVDRNPPLGPECDCGNKFSNYELMYPTNKRRDFAIKEVKREEYTMMAGVYLRGVLQLVCGATIISNYYALTAADCIERLSDHPIGLAVGIRSNAGELPLLDINYTYWSNLQTNKKTGIWDIAIVGVEKPIKFNYLVKPVCLTFKQWGRSFMNESIITLGWGNSRLIQYLTDPWHFRALPHPLVVRRGYVDSDRNCRSLGRFIDGSHMCLNYPNQSDVCKVFEGGPVLWKDPITGLLKLIGVTIHHNDCDDSASRTIAMNMSVYLGWVAGTLKGKANFCKAE